MGDKQRTSDAMGGFMLGFCWHTRTYNVKRTNNFYTLWDRRETLIFCASFLIPAGRASQPPSPWEVCPNLQQIPESEAPGAPSMEQEEACGDDSSETSEDCVLCLCLRLCKLCIIVCMVRDLLLPPFSQGDLLHFKQQAWCFFFLQVLWGIMFFFQVLWGTFYIRLHGVLFNLPTLGLVKWTCYATDFKGNTNLTTKGATLSFSYVARCFHFRFFWLAGL